MNPYDSPMPMRARGLLQQWTQALMLASVDLEALMVAANGAPCPPVLGCLSKLRYLELKVWRNEPWFAHLFIDLSFCRSLESLKITVDDPGLNYESQTEVLPDVQLAALPGLKRIQLVAWIPQAAFALPPDCELCVYLVCSQTCPWDEHWQLMQRHLTVFVLYYNRDMVPLEWPRGLQCLSRLQYFRCECDGSLEEDLAVLKAIPHVRLSFTGMASFILTAGNWESLEVHGEDGLCITFIDAAAFVRGTKRFLFVSTGNPEVSHPMFASIREACSRRFEQCYQCKFKQYWDKKQPYIVRQSNCEEVMRLEPSRDGKLVPSGGLCDGYAGTPEDSPLWQFLPNYHIVTEYDFWPEWEPYEWVLGK